MSTKMKQITLLLLISLTILACNIDYNSVNTDNISLPQNVIIQVLDFDLDNSSVTLKGSEVNNGLIGKWTLESNTSGSFFDENNSLTIFSGDLFSNHKIRWAINNNINEIFAEDIIKIADAFSLSQLLESGVEIAILVNEFSIQDLLGAGVNITDLLEVGITWVQLINANVPISDLIAAGITASQLLDANISLIEIVEAGISSIILINLGIPKDELISANIITEIPNTQLYIINFVYEKFEHANAITFCNNLVIGDMINWHLPTIEELRTIYDNKGTALLEYTNENYWSSTFSHYGTDENGTNANYFTKNMFTGFEKTFYGFEKRIIPVLQL